MAAINIFVQKFHGCHRDVTDVILVDTTNFCVEKFS